LSDESWIFEQVGGANGDEPVSPVAIATSVAAHPRRSPFSFDEDAMRSSNFDIQTWLTSYSGWAFYCALISVFGVTGYYSDLLRPLVQDWVGVGVLIAPIVIILFVHWGEFPDRVVATCHIIAASWFMILALAMELGHLLDYQPQGSGFYRILAHLGWTSAWAGIFRRARRTFEQNVERDGAANRSQPIRSETNRTSSAAGSDR